jgi:hypothetical protein
MSTTLKGEEDRLLKEASDKLSLEKDELSRKESRIEHLEVKLKDLIIKKKEQLQTLNSQFKLNQQIYAEYMDHLKSKELELSTKEKAMLARLQFIE